MGVKVVIGVVVVLLLMSLATIGFCFSQPTSQDEGPQARQHAPATMAAVR